MAGVAVSHAAQASDERLHALLGRLKEALGQLCVHCRIVLAVFDLEVQGEAAGLDDGDNVLEAGFLAADFPAGDLGALAAKAFRELVLSESCLEPCFADDLGRCHAAEVYPVLL
jgi:hypothetical protein